MIFREIQRGDLEDLFRIRIATWHNGRGREELMALGITRESVAQMLQTSHHGWLCEAEGRSVGFAMGNRLTGEMWVIAVLRDFEGRGIGQRLLRLVEDWLQEHGWQESWLTTSTDAHCRAVGFYRQAGWQDWKLERGDRYMRKPLAPAAAG